MRIIELFFILCLMLVSSCQSSKGYPYSSVINADEQAVVNSLKTIEETEAFFKNFLLFDGGIYTLYGSKPMIWGVFPEAHELTEDEVAFMNEKKNECEWQGRKVRQAVNNKGLCFFDSIENFSKRWESWQIKKNTYEIDRFLFVSWKEKKYYFFVNIPETVLVLTQKYHYFKDILGYDFSPLEVVYELKNENSDFWNKVIDNPLLQGLVLGFGERNSLSFTFANEQRDKNPTKEIFISSFSEELDVFEKPLSERNFPLPAFSAFPINNGVNTTVEKYKEERRLIIRKLKGKDFLSSVIEELTRKDELQMN